EDCKHINTIFTLVESIRPVHCGELIQSMLQLQREISQAEASLAQLDLSDFADLEEQLENAIRQHGEQEALAGQLREAAGSLKTQEAQQAVRLTKLADEQESLQARQDDLEQAVLRMAAHYAEFDSEQALAEAERKAEQAGRDFSFQEEEASLGAQLESIERALYQLIIEHNQQCNSHDAVVFDNLHERHSLEFFQRIVKLRGELDLIHNRLQNNVLVDKYDKLASLR